MYTATVPIIVDTHFEKEHLLEELRRCKADRVAFALNRDLNHTFSSPQTMNRLKELIPWFRERGYGVVVWIGETLGHDQGTLYPEGCETPYRRMKLPKKGTVASFCPTDQAFTEALCRWVGDVARMQPDLIMLDDDYRMNGGCVCATHVDWMNRELGEALTAEEWIQKAFCGRSNHYRDIWIKVQGETLCNLARALRRAVDEINPNQRLGLCATHLLWDADGACGEKLIRILAGNTKPFLRTFGAPYHSYNGGKSTLGTSVELERWQATLFRNRDFELITEGDTYPRPRYYCPASYLECFDQILRADGGTDGILKYAVDYCSDVYYEQGYTDAWERNLGLYEEIHALFDKKEAVGITPYLERNLLRDANLHNAAEYSDFKVLFYSAGSYNASATLAVMNNLPTAYRGSGAKILFGENARHIPEEELAKGCILDLAAAEILKERGIDVGFELEKQHGGFEISYLGGAEQYFLEEQEYVRISGRLLPSPVRLRENAEILTEFVSGDIRLTGWFRYENKAGQRFLVLPVDCRVLADRGNINAGYLNGYALRRMLVRQAEWLNRKPLDAYAEGNHPYLYTMVKKDDASLSIGLWNLFEDKIRDLTLHLGEEVKDLRFVNCTGVREGNKIRLTSVLYPFEFAGIELFR